MLKIMWTVIQCFVNDALLLWDGWRYFSFSAICEYPENPSEPAYVPQKPLKGCYQWLSLSWKLTLRENERDILGSVAVEIFHLHLNGLGLALGRASHCWLCAFYLPANSPQMKPQFAKDLGDQSALLWVPALSVVIGRPWGLLLLYVAFSKHSAQAWVNTILCYILSIYDLRRASQWF